MKLKQFLLGIAFIFYCGMFFTSCAQDDEMHQGGTASGNDPSNMTRSTRDSSTIDTTFITVPDFTND